MSNLNQAIKLILFLALWPFCNDIYASSSIYNLCPNVRKLSVVSTPEDLEKVMCTFQHDYAGNKPITNLTNSILNTLNELKNKTLGGASGWDRNEHLYLDLEKLSDRLNNINSGNENITNGTPLQKAIFNLNEKWGDVKVRTKPENTLSYVNDFKNILSLTKTGKRVLECYEKAKGPLISSDKIVEIPISMKKIGMKMAFSIEPDEKLPNKFVKKLYFNSEINPFEALAVFTHELQHGCNSNNVAELSLELNQLPEDHLTEVEAKKNQTLLIQQNQNAAIDEMRAYHVSVNIFKDLAGASPSYFCNSYSQNSLFGKQVLSTAEYAANLEDKFEDGTYPQYLVNLYASHGLLAPETVLQKDSDGLITKKLRSDLIEKLQSEGVYVAP